MWKIICGIINSEYDVEDNLWNYDVSKTNIEWTVTFEESFEGKCFAVALKQVKLLLQAVHSLFGDEPTMEDIISLFIGPGSNFFSNFSRRINTASSCSQKRPG